MVTSGKYLEHHPDIDKANADAELMSSWGWGIWKVVSVSTGRIECLWIHGEKWVRGGKRG